MTLSFKSILVIIVTAILHVHAFSQGNTTAQTLYDSGEAMAKKSPDKAFSLLERAMNLSRENRDWKLYLNSLNTIASIDWPDREKQELVFNWLKEAFEVLKNSEEDNALAQLHYNTGEFYNNITIEIEAPIYHYQKAKKIWTLLKGEWSEEVSNCYHGLGNIYKYKKFDFYEAEKCYETALLIREKIQFKDLDVLYKNYYSLATTNRSQRDFEKALSYGTKTLEVARKFGPLRVEMSNGMIANIYRDMQEFSLAKKYYLNALTVNEKTKNLGNRAWYYSCLGDTFKNDSLFIEALEYFKKAYTLYTIPEVNEQGLFINLLINMMETYSLLKDEKNFFRTAKEVLSELDSLGMLHSTEGAQVWLVFANHQQRKLSYDSALFYLQRSLNASIPSFKTENFYDNPTENMIGFRYYVNEILIKKAYALKQKFSLTKDVTHLNQSLACLRLAEKLLSKQRNTLDMESAKWEFLESKYDLYDDIISSLYEGAKNLPADTLNLLAFQYFEQSKARSLADALVEAEQTKQISADDSLLRLHADLKRQLLSIQDGINKESEKPNGSKKIAELREQLVRLDQDIQACKFAIEERYPGYFNAKYGYRPVSLAVVQKTLKAKHQVLLEYFWGNEAVYAIAVSDDLVSFKRVGSLDSIMVVVNNLLTHLTDERSSMNIELFKSFTKNSNDLYKILVEPFLPLIAGNKSIQIIPDGSISQIPFEILLDQTPAVMKVDYRSLRYLIKSYTIGYAYSSSMFLRQDGSKSIATPSLLAIGFTGGERLRSIDEDLEEIAGSEEELKALEKRFRTGKFLVGNEATESNFKTLAPAFDILHLAVHGMGDVQKNFAASLYFGSKYDTLEDGELHTYELYGLKLKAQMAVLTSCESGLGKGYKGEGMISMASAFTYSGCKNILMSLWKVNDQASITLMDNFYEHLLKGESIDEALRQAKLSYLASSDELTADPKVWAPLIAYGNLDNVFQKDKSRIFIFSGLLLFIILFLSFKIYKRYLNR